MMLKQIFPFRHLREFDNRLILEAFVVTHVTHASVFIHPTASRKLMSNMLTVLSWPTHSSWWRPC